MNKARDGGRGHRLRNCPHRCWEKAPIPHGINPSPHGFATYAELNLDTHDPLQILTACGHLVQLGQLLI